ncbi:MAG: hypothetical protein COW00_14585 [Bdellovibrio sp. CG12_big_fil_rev_8_21_14_0_65_39_13]|nr:MAG: hypothetical protein COW78_07670 [Bdellovibrio sp. CG22_combo_CG10-13_8_21_14_all_39_27]PIQ58839.1 MAG: hypothetical protein COW00_14585 [Bdellovibrio sp. CG12_big_fil_rev_8_21_14_0_65_39_13]PIR35483.1 MAG: hypothetical protein COV37_08365 [Bdellovibrio sp. CG11_big_fil_rev_8_21_14_0_20_39_38]
MKITDSWLKLFFVFSLITSSPIVADDSFHNEFNSIGKKLESLHLESLPIKDNGRLKPLDTFARETNLFVTGKKSLFGLSASSFFLALHKYPNISSLRIINIRDTHLRESLNLEKGRTLFSLNEIEKTNIQQLAMPAFEVEQKNKKLLTPLQTSQIELVHQTSVVRSIGSGDVLTQGLIYDDFPSDHYLPESLEGLLSLAQFNNNESVMNSMTKEIHQTVLNQKMNPEFEIQRTKMGIEVFYNQWNFFLFAGLFYLLLSFALFLPYVEKKLSDRTIVTLLTIPLLFLITGFSLRVYITDFPPVTNMYGTMVWVSFGISLFSYIFYFLYKDRSILGIMSLGIALLLLLTDNIPLIISPSMDPIMAVLRSSYWLTIHVLTVTISYAAFSMAMILGNVIIVKSLLNKVNDEEVKRFSHYAYRSIQLGVLLLTAGIILGGVWADYSWGRFWGWDPKETWALIADLGFLALLHGRYVGWIRPMRLLVLAPLTYLLVIMAWFGVNFVLSAGLHSYGFSSGGTFMVVTVIAVQLLLYAAYSSKLVLHSKK